MDSRRTMMPPAPGSSSDALNFERMAGLRTVLEDELLNASYSCLTATLLDELANDDFDRGFAMDLFEDEPTLTDAA